MSVRELEPRALWNNFADLNAVPRASKKEERVIQFMMDFGNRLDLETIKDSVGNVVIKKPATSGMEGRKTIIMQSHLDMVHQKNSDSDFNFESDGIEMIVEDDWVHANGTTLGADNGIGVATIMAILEAKDLTHPAIEAMFTIDEETGMTGAINLDSANFSGEILLNLDTEDDDELSVGCAGGIDTNTTYSFTTVPVKDGFETYEIALRGLLGGHSGMDIDSGRGNANKFMNRILRHLVDTVEMQLLFIDGGSLRNAIPRESTAVIAVKSEDRSAMEDALRYISSVISVEYRSIEQGMTVEIQPCSHEGEAVSSEDTHIILDVLQAVHNGVYRMSPDIEGLVETSSSLARVIVNDGEFSTQSLQRSSVESTKDDIAATIGSAFELIGCKVVQSGEYPGWQPNAGSKILNLMADLYRERYNEEPQIKACHAGLECGILSQHLPGVDMISIGPNIRAPHSPDEKCQISSVQKFWGYLLATLELIPLKEEVNAATA
jgi:dipeptidase D